MMSSDSGAPASVFRLLPGMNRQSRTVLPDDEAMIRLIQWERGVADTPPEAVGGRWNGSPGQPACEFPTGSPEGPILSRRIAEALGDDLLKAGRCIPVPMEGDDPGDYVFYVVEAVVDCLDAGLSSEPDGFTGRIEQTTLRPDAVPVDLPAFRLPQAPTSVHWTGWAAARLKALLGDELELRLIWSADPTQTPHPNPWGF